MVGGLLWQELTVAEWQLGFDSVVPVSILISVHAKL
jgi:hypothetical protein